MAATRATPELTTRKKVIISNVPHSGSKSLPTKTTVTMSTTTSHQCISRKQWVNAVHNQKCGGQKYPGVTLRAKMADSEYDKQ